MSLTVIKKDLDSEIAPTEVGEYLSHNQLEMVFVSFANVNQESVQWREEQDVISYHQHEFYFLYLWMID